jgi:hypothetical protein
MAQRPHVAVTGVMVQQRGRSCLCCRSEDMISRVEERSTARPSQAGTMAAVRFTLWRGSGPVNGEWKGVGQCEALSG